MLPTTPHSTYYFNDWSQWHLNMHKVQSIGRVHTWVCKNLPQSLFISFQTYVYVLDSETPPLDLDTIKDHYHKTSVKEDSYDATAHMSLWEPRLPTDNSSELGTLPGPRGETFSSSLRFYSFKDILESYDAAIKGVCLVPTQMNKIYCQVTHTTFN